TGAGLGALVALAASRAGDLPAVLFAAGQAAYLAAATVLLVLGRERLLLYALLPMTAGAVTALGLDLPEWLRAGLLLGSLGAVVALAVRDLPSPTTLAAHHTAPTSPTAISEDSRSATAVGRRSAGRNGWAQPKVPSALNAWPRPAPVQETRKAGPRLTASIPYAVFGLGTGALVLHAALGEVFADGATAAIAAPAAVALTLSMGPAEWLLHRFRSQGLAGLRRTGTPAAFWRSTTGTLVKCLTAYALVLTFLYIAGTALWPDAPEADLDSTLALLLLGTVMWTGLLLQAFGAVHTAATICATAALAQTAAVLTGTGTPGQVGLIVPGATALVLATLVCVLLGRATAHRA
ncbi:hypothetical protein P8605_46775, partial [Streptomyces sp. T-3]|nr:hypothetical protein [Streptomyces sp. T-3]